MSVRYDLSKIRDHESLCWESWEGDSPPPDDGTIIDWHSTDEGYRRLGPATTVLVLGSLGVGMPEITRQNFHEVFIRHEMFNILGSEQENWCLPITLADVRAHIGLTVNVPAMTDLQFNSHFGAEARHYAEAMRYSPVGDDSPAFLTEPAYA